MGEGLKETLILVLLCSTSHKKEEEEFDNFYFMPLSFVSVILLVWIFFAESDS